MRIIAKHILRAFRTELTFLAMFLAPALVFAGNISYLGKPSPGNTVLGHPFFQIPRVSKSFCQQYLSETNPAKIIDAGLGTLDEINFKERAQPISSCLEVVDSVGKNIWGVTDSTQENPETKPLISTKQDELYYIWVRNLQEDVPVYAWRIDNKGFTYKVVSICGKTCIELQRVDANEPTSPLKIDVGTRTKLPREIAEYASLVGNVIDFSEQARHLYDHFIPFGTGSSGAENYYLQRRLVSRFAGYIRAGGDRSKIEQFCELYGQEQDRDATFAKFFSGHRFFTTEQWRMAEKYGLTEHEVASIKMYTGEWSNVNRKLRAKEPLKEDEKVFNEELLKALNKIEPYHGIVKRWVELPREIESTYSLGKVIEFGAYTSTSMGNWTGGRPRFVIYSGSKGKDISPIGIFEHGQEVLFPPDAKFKILDVISHPMVRYSSETNSNEPATEYTYVLGEVDGEGNLVTGQSYKRQEISEEEKCQQAICQCPNGTLIVFDQGPSRNGTCR